MLSGPLGESCFSLLWEVSPEIGLWIVGAEGGSFPHLFPAYLGGAGADVRLLEVRAADYEATAVCEGASFHLNNFVPDRLWDLRPGTHRATIAGLAYGWHQASIVETGMEMSPEPCVARFAGTVANVRRLQNPHTGLTISHLTLDFGLEVIGAGEASPGDRIWGEAWLHGTIAAADSAQSQLT